MQVLVVAALVALVTFVAGQEDTDSSLSDLEYRSGEFLDDEGDLEDYLPVRSRSEQRFLEGLVVEAGRHVLFPQLYSPPRVKSINGKYLTVPEEAIGKARFYEVRGQPEMEQSYLNSKRTPADDCPHLCPAYRPVCGSDGKVYDSECHMLKENCGSAGVRASEWSRCEGKHHTCPSSCLDINDPVCGSDGRIYRNVCLLRKNNCGKYLGVLPVKECYENTRQTKTHYSCPQKCQDLYKPVCGSDGVIYFNDCFMRKRTCLQGVSEVPMESCGATFSACPEVCLPIFDPVCGSDGQLYVNVCRMLQETCGKEVKPVRRNFCRTAEESLETLPDV